MLTFLIIGLVFLALAYPLNRILEKRNSRWSNLALALCIIFGIVCIGIFAGIDWE